MELFTKSKDVNWNRIVNLFVNEKDDLKTMINDRTTCKIIIIQSGAGIVKIDDRSFVISAPMIICLNPSNVFGCTQNSNLEACTIYFKSDVLNDTFNHEKIISGYFDNMKGTTVYQDYILLRKFYSIQGADSVVKLTSSNILKVQNLKDKIKGELSKQADGFWPCRSRSFFLELLFLLNSFNLKSNEFVHDEVLEIDNKIIAKVICYLNENLSQKITLDFLAKKFLINRNKLNEEFKKYTGLTCISYLLKIRMNLSCILLYNTDLPVSEISERVGFSDTNYFVKTFKNYHNITPSKFRQIKD